MTTATTLSALAALALLSPSASQAAGAVPLPRERPPVAHVADDYGGTIMAYARRVEAIQADARRRVELSGECASACTMYLALLPTGQVCATKGTVLYFHAMYPDPAKWRAVIALLIGSGASPEEAEAYLIYRAAEVDAIYQGHWPPHVRQIVAPQLPRTSPSRFFVMHAIEEAEVPQCEEGVS